MLVLMMTSNILTSLGSEIINVKKCNEKEISEGCFLHNFPSPSSSPPLTHFFLLLNAQSFQTFHHHHLLQMIILILIKYFVLQICLLICLIVLCVCDFYACFIHCHIYNKKQSQDTFFLNISFTKSMIINFC